MLKIRSFKSISKGTILGVLLSILSLSVVLASYLYSITVNIANNSEDDYENVPVIVGINGQHLVDTGYIDSSGLNTDVKVNSTSVPFMLTDDRLCFILPTMTAYGSAAMTFYLGTSDDLTGFKIIPGAGGYVTTPDNESLEQGEESITVSINYYTDTSTAETIWGKGETLFLNNNGDGTLTAVLDDGENQYSATTSVINNGLQVISTTLTAGGTGDGETNDGGTIIEENCMSSVASVPTAAGISRYAEKITDYTGTINLVSFWLRRVEPTVAGTVYARIRNASTGAIIATIGSVDGESITTANDGSGSDSENWIDFSGDSVTLDEDDIRVTVEYDSGTSVSTGIRTGLHTGNPTAFGIASGYVSQDANGDPVDAWQDWPTADLPFRFIGDSTESTISISVDGIELDSQSAVVMPDTSEDWVFTPSTYFDSIEILIDDVSTLLYEPEEMIYEATIQDLRSTENGIITFGETSFDITINPIVPAAGTTPTIGDPNVLPPWPKQLPYLPSWFGGCANIDKLPFYDTFNERASDLGMSTCVLYFLMMMATVSAVGLGILLFTGSAVLTIGGMIMALGAAVGTTAVPGFLILGFIIIAFGIYYLSRQH